MSAVYAAFAVSAALLVSACGGGGGGGDAQGEPSSTPSSENSGVDNGVSSASGAITSSRSFLDFSVFRRADGSYGATTPASAANVHISFKGDGALIGFAPGVTPPAWLKLPSASSTPITAPDKQIDVSIGVAPQGLSAGKYATSLRFVTGMLGNNASISYVDVPVRITVLAAPEVYSGPVVSFETKEGQASGSKSLTLNFGALTSVKLSASAGNANSIGSTWLDVQLDEKDNRKLNLSVKPEAIAGSYEGYAVVKYTWQGTSDEKLIPVRLKVATAGPVVDYASPPLQYLNKPANVIIRGRGFASAPLNGVLLGTQAASTYTLVNDTQIVAHFDKVAATGKWPVRLQFAKAEVSAPGMIEVRAPLTLAALDLDLGEGVSGTAYDALRQSLLVKTEKRLIRLAQVDGAWKTVASRDMPVFAQFDYTPDYSQILVTSRSDGFEMLDAETLQLVRVIGLPNPVTGGVGGYSYMSLEGVMNNGDVVLSIQQTPADAIAYAVFRLSNQTLSKTSLMTPYRANLPSYFRDRLLFIQRLAGWGETGFIGYYDAASGGFLPLALPINSGTEGQYSFAANGNLVELTKEIFDINAGLSKTSIRFPDGIDDNGPVRISSDGRMMFFTSPSDGYIKAYGLDGGALVAAGQYRFAPFHWYAGGTQTYLTPDNQAMIMAGGLVSGTGLVLERRVVVIPLH